MKIGSLIILATSLFSCSGLNTSAGLNFSEHEEQYRGAVRNSSDKSQGEVEINKKEKKKSFGILLQSN